MPLSHKKHVYVYEESVFLVSVVVQSYCNTSPSIIIDTGLCITCTSHSYSPIQQQWGITYNCVVGLFLSHVSPNSVLLTSGIWLSQKLTRTERETVWTRGREGKKASRERQKARQAIPQHSGTQPIFLSDRIISMHSTGEWKLPFTHKNMARIVNYPQGLFFSLCRPFAYCAYEKVLLM